MIAVSDYLILNENLLALGDLFGEFYHLEILVVPFVFPLCLYILHSSFFIRLTILIISYVLIQILVWQALALFDFD